MLTSKTKVHSSFCRCKRRGKLYFYLLYLLLLHVTIECRRTNEFLHNRYVNLVIILNTRSKQIHEYRKPNEINWQNENFNGMYKLFIFNIMFYCSHYYNRIFFYKYLCNFKSIDISNTQFVQVQFSKRGGIAETVLQMKDYLKSVHVRNCNAVPPLNENYYVLPLNWISARLISDFILCFAKNLND